MKRVKITTSNAELEEFLARTDIEIINVDVRSCEQSERLLALGLKKETADCYWFYCDIAKKWKCTILSSTQVFEDYPTTVIPAWSLYRLWELLGKIKKYEGEDELLYPRISLEEDDVIFVSPKSIWSRRNFCSPKGAYENIINCLEELIKEGYFNKEYLEDKK